MAVKRLLDAVVPLMTPHPPSSTSCSWPTDVAYLTGLHLTFARLGLHLVRLVARAIKKLYIVSSKFDTVLHKQS